MRKINSIEAEPDSLKEVIKTAKLEIYSENGSEIKEFIDSNGLMSIRYRDEYVGGSWVSASGASAPDNTGYTIGGVPINLLTFDGNNTTERISNSFEIPHDVALDKINNSELSIEWHIHFMSSITGTGTVKWTINYCYLPPNNIPINQPGLTIIQNVTGLQYTHFIKGVTIPVPEGGFQIGGIILFTLSRNPIDVGDTYNNDIILIKTALHVPINESGSRQIYTK